MNKSNKKAGKFFHDKEHRAARFAYSQAKFKEFAKDMQLEHCMDLDSDLVLGNMRSIHKTDMRF